MIEHAGEIVGIAAEVQRPLVIVAIAVAAGIPGRSMIIRSKGLDLVRPVEPIAPDTMQKNDQFAFAVVLDGDARGVAELFDSAEAALS